MGKVTGIAWCDHTFNPWIGCTKISPGCDHCYAERDFCLRRKRVQWGPGAERKRTSDAYWRQPAVWNRNSWKIPTHRPRVFCGSLCDVMDPEVPREWRLDLWDVINRTALLDWMLLTKRPQNVQRMLPWWLLDQATGQFKTLWLGVTAEDQACADARIPLIQHIPSRVRFLSCEPLLGPLDLSRHLEHVQLVIVGGESGPKARSMDPAWVRVLRDQCARAGVAFFFKQWGPAIDAPTQDHMPVLDGMVHAAFPVNAAPTAMSDKV